MVALPVKVLPGVTWLMRDELLSAALERENELSTIARMAASVTYRIAKDKIPDRVELIDRSKHDTRALQGQISDEIVNFDFLEYPHGLTSVKLI